MVNATVKSQVLATRLNLSMLIYFYTYIIIIKSVILIVIFTIILVNTLINVYIHNIYINCFIKAIAPYYIDYLTAFEMNIFQI